MNFFHALNQGDASLKEPHFTSLLFYIFRETTIYYPSSSFLDFFIDSFIKQTPTTKDCDSFDVETDIKIEEILTDGALRKDLDISIYLRKSEKLTIINIENKINNVAYVPGQIQEQASLLSNNNPYAINIENILKANGIEKNRIVSKWYGERVPFDGCLTEYPCPIPERKQNRRVEIRLIDVNKMKSN